MNFQWELIRWILTEEKGRRYQIGPVLRSSIKTEMLRDGQPINVGACGISALKSRLRLHGNCTGVFRMTLLKVGTQVLPRYCSHDHEQFIPHFISVGYKFNPSWNWPFLPFIEESVQWCFYGDYNYLALSVTSFSKCPSGDIPLPLRYQSLSSKNVSLTDLFDLNSEQLLLVWSLLLLRVKERHKCQTPCLYPPGILDGLIKSEYISVQTFPCIRYMCNIPPVNAVRTAILDLFKSVSTSIWKALWSLQLCLGAQSILLSLICIGQGLKWLPSSDVLFFFFAMTEARKLYYMHKATGVFHKVLIRDGWLDINHQQEGM